MRKILSALFMMAALTASAASEVTYKDDMVVSTSVRSTDPIETVIVVTEDEGSYTLTLKNFMFSYYDEEEEEDLAVYFGTFTMNDITATTQSDGTIKLEASEDVEMTAGDLEGVDEDEWFGPFLAQLGSTPVTMTATIYGDNNEKLYAEFSIDLSVMYLGTYTAVFGDNSTLGISEVTAGKASDDSTYYNLSGMRVNNPSKGVYIVGGKKVIVK